MKHFCRESVILTVGFRISVCSCKVSSSIVKHGGTQALGRSPSARGEDGKCWGSSVHRGHCHISSGHSQSQTSGISSVPLKLGLTFSFVQFSTQSHYCLCKHQLRNILNLCFAKLILTGSANCDTPPPRFRERRRLWKVSATEACLGPSAP